MAWAQVSNGGFCGVSGPGDWHTYTTGGTSGTQTPGGG